MKLKLTEKDLILLAELREIVQDLLEDEFEETNDYLITWLKSANFDVQKATEALRKNKLWRKEQNMDQILTEDMEDLNENYPVVQTGFDKEGCPLMVLRLNGDIRKVVDESPNGKYRYIRHMMKHCEQMMSTLRKQYFQTDGNVTNFCAIVDMEGFNFKQLFSTKVISAITEVTRTAEDNFPNTIKTLYFVNTPKLLKILLNILKPFLSAETISRLRILDSNKIKWREAILKDITEDQLPHFLLHSG